MDMSLLEEVKEGIDHLETTLSQLRLDVVCGHTEQFTESRFCERFLQWSYKKVLSLICKKKTLTVTHGQGVSDDNKDIQNWKCL